MLINAAVSGRADHLHGLKENVIIGRKIPVGTGVESADVDDLLADADEYTEAIAEAVDEADVAES